MNELEEHVLELIGEDTASPDVFTDTEAGMAPIRDSLNAAIEEIAMVTGSQKRVYRVPLRANRSFYRLALTQDELGWITDVWLFGIRRRLRQVSLPWLNAYNPRWLYNVGTPERYVPIGFDMLCLHPAASADSDQLEITAVVVPSRYASDSDRIKLRENFQWAAVHYAVSEYYAGRGDAKRAEGHLADYMSQLGEAEMYREQRERSYFFQTEKRDELGNAAV